MKEEFKTETKHRTSILDDTVNKTEQIFDMLDLFYANKHLYEKIKRREECYERERSGI